MIDWKKPLDWDRPIAVILFTALIAYGGLIGFSLGVLAAELPISPDLWKIVIPATATVVGGTLIAKYVEDRKDRRELRAPINEVCETLHGVASSIRRFGSVLRNVRAFSEGTQQQKVDLLNDYVTLIQTDAALVEPSSSLHQVHRDLIKERLDAAVSWAIQGCQLNRSAILHLEGSDREEEMQRGQDNVADAEKLIEATIAFLRKQL